MVYTISISVWITSIDAHKIHSVSASGNEKDNILVRVLTNIIIELEKLQNDRMQVAK
jgi:hypothetical protein